MQLNSTLEKFYLSILDYSGLKLEDNIFINKNEKIGDFSLEGKSVTLPYFENLKHPGGRHIFHPLHESYVKPEVPLFNLYKRRLVCEINLKLVQLFTTIAHIAVSVELQNKIRDAKLLKFISEFKDLDMVFVENLMRVVKYSREVNDEAFVLDIFLKKNGEIKDVPYSAIGKVNFILYEEVKKTLNESTEYKLFGCKIRKKDLNILYNLFNVIFPDIDDKDIYSDGTDNKVFRYLNILLKTAYIVTSRVNEIVDMIYTIKDETILTDLKFNDDWSELLEEVYGLTNEIRMIPNQTDASVKEPPVKHLSVSEVSVNNPPMEPAQILRQNNPQMPQQQPMMHPQFQPQFQQAADPNDILRNLTNARMTPAYHPQQMMPQQMQQPVPNWVREQEMRNSGMNPNMTPQYPQGMMPQMQQPMQQYPQGMMPQQYPQGMMPQQYPQGMMPQYPQGMMPQMQQPMQQYPQQMMPQQPPSMLDPMFHGRARPNM